MSKSKNKNRRGGAVQTSKAAASNRKRWIPIVAVLVVAGIIAVALLAARANRAGSGSKSLPSATAPAQGPETTPPSELVPMDVAKAVMVTAELDFGPKVPTIAEALIQIERRYQPDDGQGRTFAVLDAYGEATPEGKLHISMHVSSEKPGGGQLIFKRTGEVLWRGKINPISTPLPPKTLTIQFDNKGTTVTIDGATNPTSIIGARVQPGDLMVRDIWPDGQERELTFIYSACGCPVHVLARRVGERTVRVKDMPVIFPDDPPAVTLITQLMGW